MSKRSSTTPIGKNPLVIVLFWRKDVFAAVALQQDSDKIIVSKGILNDIIIDSGFGFNKKIGWVMIAGKCRTQ